MMRKLILLSLICFLASYALAVIAPVWRVDAPQYFKTATITNASLTANVVTITTLGAHNFRTGEYVNIQTGNTILDTNTYGSYSISGVPSPNTFTYARTAGNIPALTPIAGTARVEWLRVNGNNRGAAYNPGGSPPDILVSRGSGAGSGGVSRINAATGAYIGELKVGADVWQKTISLNTAILDTTQPHLLALNQSVRIALNPPDTTFDGTYTVNGIIDADTFTYARTAADIGPLGTGGFVDIFTGSTLVLDKIRVANEHIYGSTLTASEVSTTDLFVLYHWANEAAVPQVIFRNNAVGAVAPTFAVGPQIPYSVKGTQTVINKELISNYAKLTLSALPIFRPGQGVTIAGVDATFNGSYLLTEVDYVNNILIYYKAAADVLSIPSAGTVVNNAAYTIRVGDTLDATADGLGMAEIYTAIAFQGGNGPCYGALKFTYPEGAPAVIGITDIVLQGHDGGYTVLPDGCIYVDGFGGNIYRNTQRSTGVWTNAGVRISPPGLLRLPYQIVPGYNFEYSSYGYQNAGCFAAAADGRKFTVGPNTYFVYIDNASCGYPDANAYYNRAAVADITAGYDKAKYIDYTAFPTPINFSNGNGSGDITAIMGTPGRFAALATNISLGVYDIPSPGVVQPKTWDYGATTDNWSDANNWAPDGVPTAYDNVVLDHTTVGPAYNVVIGGIQTAICRTLLIDPANLTKIALKINSLGLGCGAAFQIVGSGLSDLTIGGTLALPTTKDQSYRPRYRVEILKGTVDVINKVIAANTATLTTVVAHNYAIGDSITVNIGDVLYDGPWILTAAAGTTFSYAVPTVASPSTPCWGTAAIGTDTFRWNNVNSTSLWAPGGVGVYEQNGATGVAITAGVPQALSDGISVTFAAGTGHYVGNAWLFNPLTAGNALVISGDDTVTYDLQVANGGYIENMSGARYASLPGIINNWGGGNKSRFGANGYYVQQNYNQGSLQAFAWSFPSDKVSEYPVFDGATEWDQNSNYVVDIFGFIANFPSMSRSFNFGNVICRNSYPLIYATAAYSNLANAFNIGFNNVICEAGTTFSGQTNSPYTITVKGDLNNQGTGALSLDSTAAGLVGLVFDGTSNIVASAGTYVLPSGFTVNGTKSANLLSPYILTKRGTVNGTFTTNSNNLTINDATVGYGIQVKLGGTFQCSDQTIGGTGNFAVESGGTLNMKHIGGIDGQITVAGTKTYDAGGTYVYNGNPAQVTGASLPALIAGLGIDNPLGVTLSGNVATTNNLALTNGELITSGFVLTAADGAGGITRTNGFVVGTLTRVIGAGTTGARDFPVGTAGKYVPVVVDITSAGSGTGTLAINTVDDYHPASFWIGNAIKRYWTLGTFSPTGWTADITFYYLEGDLNGADETTFIGGRWTDAPLWIWTWFSGASSQRDTVNNWVKVIGATQMSDWTLCEESTPVTDWMLN